jgi:hypothetical protein
MSEGELGKQLKQKILDGEGKVSFAFGVSPILDTCLENLLRGQPELSPQTLRWLKFWFGFDVDKVSHERCDIGVKVLEANSHE